MCTPVTEQTVQWLSEESVGRSYRDINPRFLGVKDNLQSLEQPKSPPSSLGRGEFSSTGWLSFLPGRVAGLMELEGRPFCRFRSGLKACGVEG